jgi:hypothetical protein
MGGEAPSRNQDDTGVAETKGGMNVGTINRESLDITQATFRSLAQISTSHTELCYGALFAEM